MKCQTTKKVLEFFTGEKKEDSPQNGRKMW
jgi:hypothetical protein